MSSPTGRNMSKPAISRRSTTWSTGTTSSPGHARSGCINGKTYGVPQEAYTNEIYYNKDLLKKLGVELPANAQFTQSQFLDLVKKAKAAGITPIAQGVGDRPFPGAYILGEALLRKLGKDDYRKLWTGKLSFEDPRVVEVFKWIEGARRCRRLSEELHDAQARRVALLLLHEARAR